MLSKERKRVTLNVPYWEKKTGNRVEATVDEVFYDGGWGDVLSRYEVVAYHWETLHTSLRYPHLAGFLAWLRSKISRKRPIARLVSR